MKKNAENKKALLKALLIAALVLICVLLGVVCFVLQKHSVPAPADIPSASSKQTLLFSCGTDQLKSVVITPDGGDSYTLVFDGQHLDTPDLENYPIRPLIESVIIDNATHISAEETILDLTKNVVDLKSFGLEPPVCQAVLNYQDGTQHTLSIGNQVPHGIPYFYFMMDDLPFIYAGSTDMYDAFANRFESLHPVETPQLNPQLFDLIELTGENNLKMVYTSFGWQLEKPFSYPLDSKTMETFLSRIKNIRFSQYVGKTDALDLKQFGLDEPRLTLKIAEAESAGSGTDSEGKLISFTLPEKEHIFTFGSPYNDYSFYVSYDGTVYIGTAFTLDFLWHFNPQEALSAYPLNVDIRSVRQLHLASGDISADYKIKLIEQLQLNGEFAVDEFGNILYDMQILKGSEELPARDFLIWFSSLRSLCGQGASPKDFIPEGEPVFTVFMQNGELTREVSFYPLDALHDVMTVNGTSVSYLPRSAWEQLLPWP